MSPDDIDKLTIAEVRAIAERASEALSTLRELGLVAPAGGAGVVSAVPTRPGSSVASAAPTSPFPCPTCGRTATERPGEATQAVECLQCGNHLPLAGGAPGVRVSNKGPLVMDADMLARRQSLIAQPAFDENGEPT